MKEVYEYNVLLSRENFRKIGFRRTQGHCCIPGCKCIAGDAHHIMDRKLWNNGGYYLFNCAPLCKTHHWDAEQGRYTPIQIMQFANIDIKYLRKPDKIDWLTDEEYKELFIKGEINKWGQ